MYTISAQDIEAIKESNASPTKFDNALSIIQATKDFLVECSSAAEKVQEEILPQMSLDSEEMSDSAMEYKTLFHNLEDFCQEALGLAASSQHSIDTLIHFREDWEKEAADFKNKMENIVDNHMYAGMSLESFNKNNPEYLRALESLEKIDFEARANQYGSDYANAVRAIEEDNVGQRVQTLKEQANDLNKKISELGIDICIPENISERLVKALLGN